MSSCNGNHTYEELVKNTRPARESSTDSYDRVPLETDKCPIHHPKDSTRHKHYLLRTQIIGTADYKGLGTDLETITARDYYYCTQKGDRCTKPRTLIRGTVTAEPSYSPRSR